MTFSSFSLLLTGYVLKQRLSGYIKNTRGVLENPQGLNEEFRHID